MSAKHTPGPWAIRIVGTSHRIDVRGGHVSGVSAFIDTGWPHTEQQEEQRANARLMAAAPELLEVAQLLALATDEGDDLATGTHYLDKNGRIRCKGSFLDAIERARAAIAKATGDQP